MLAQNLSKFCVFQSEMSSMLCTHCREEVKPVVALDIDGTTGRYHEHFLRFAENYLDKEIVWDYDGQLKFRSWFRMRFGVGDDVWHDVKLAYRQGGMKRSMPVYPYARNLAEFIREQGAELWITTTRPYIRHDNIDPDTREWLRRNNIRYDYILYDGHKYGKLRDLVGAERVAMVIDDLREELIEAEMAGFNTNGLFLRRNAFNDAAIWPQEINNLSDATTFTKDRINVWRELNDNRG
jgi:hypothetical protein